MSHLRPSPSDLDFPADQSVHDRPDPEVRPTSRVQVTVTIDGEPVDLAELDLHPDARAALLALFEERS